MPSRSGTVFLLGVALATAACDRQTPVSEQANVAASGAVTSDEVAPGAAKPAAAAGTVDRSHKGEAAPTASFYDAAGKKITDLKHKAADLQSASVRYVGDEPVKSVLIAAAGGALLTALFVKFIGGGRRY